MSKGQRIITAGLWGVLLLAMAGVVVGKLWGPRLGLTRPGLTRSDPTRSDLTRPTPSGPALTDGTGPASRPDTFYPAADFDLTDQDGKPFSSKSLIGRPWIAAFIFTSCGGVCPKMTATMVSLQPRLPASVQLVSFTVNPEYDTPPILKQYAALFKADESHWRFLTGTRPQMLDVVQKMKLPFREADAESPILHSQKLVLVDAAGMVRGYYDRY